MKYGADIRSIVSSTFLVGTALRFRVLARGLPISHLGRCWCAFDISLVVIGCFRSLIFGIDYVGSGMIALLVLVERPHLHGIVPFAVLWLYPILAGFKFACPMPP